MSLESRVKYVTLPDSRREPRSSKGEPRVSVALNRIVSGVLCDIPLGSHPAMYNMAEKYAKLGYKAELDLVEGIFTRALAEQKKTAAQPAQN